MLLVATILNATVGSFVVVETISHLDKTLNIQEGGRG